MNNSRLDDELEQTIKDQQQQINGLKRQLSDESNDAAKFEQHRNELQARNAQLVDALEHIISHQQIVGGTASGLSVTVNIARQALSNQPNQRRFTTL